ncbi:lasso peptide biosynthesis B2 protein [Brevundimonas staleyi]|uniref:Lasso peptide biosynthesis B2 protein n=1 Tax=Brevundimonas staleyi TaxID=74326 RepID=A0ABW0FVF0_9CAUL
MFLSPGPVRLASTTPSAVWLRADVHAVCIGRDVVLLDLGGDAYACLPDGTDEMRIDDHGTVVGAKGRIADLLLDAGLAATARPAGPSRMPLPAVATEALPARDVRVTRFDDPLALIWAALALRSRGRDPAVVDLLPLTSGAGGRRTREAVIQAASAVDRLLPWVPITGGCLRRSACLVAFLKTHGLAADWVFGVRTWPFRAHCWVQLDEICLNDDPERLRAYRPILSR